MPRSNTATRRGAILACVLALAVLLVAAWLEGHDPDAYYQAVQEDELLEWGTFWLFLVAAGLFLLAARAERNQHGGLPWFLLGLGLFCFVVGMEEISWGQRILGYRPPEYFLAHNYQQELNFHNVVGTSERKLALKLILVGYGVVLPLIALVPAVGGRLRRLGIRAPHPGLALPFAAAAIVYETYPWRFTGEWVELVAGLGFLFAADLHRSSPPPTPTAPPAWRTVAPVALAFVLALVTTMVWRHERRVDPATAASAAGEVQALLADFRSGKLASRCNLHRRLYTYMERWDQGYLLEGRFAGLTTQGLPEARARFLLDPWNSPYWIRHRCSSSGDREVAFVYSFGPNRRRDSTRWEIKGDDVGGYIYRKQP